VPPAERGIAEMMVSLFETFAEPLSDELMFAWHRMVMSGARGIHTVGAYRTHDEPMQVVSGRIDDPKVHFVAPPSKRMGEEMKAFVAWFNRTASGGWRTCILSASIRSRMATGGLRGPWRKNRWRRTLASQR